jgi:hypothetical protein
MNIRIILLLLVLFVLYSCSNKNYKIIESSDHSRPAIFQDNFTKAIYKTSFEFYNRSISGITVIKKTDSSYRMVSMSEVGLKYFDMEFFIEDSKESVVHYVMEVLNRKMLLSRLTSDFNLLFNYPKNERRINTVDKDLVKSGKFIYKGESKVEIVTISNFLTKARPIINISYSDAGTPSNIKISRSKINITFDEIKQNN